MQKGLNIIAEPKLILEGLPFALTLMTILLVHELGHYIASRIHRTEATLPYFIPAPSFIGTFGAFIKMKSPIITRKALIDIGASGPIAGFVVSVVASFWGLYHSEVIPIDMAYKSEGVLTLGDSLLFNFLSWLAIGVMPANHDILLHPVAFAGWIGLFVTSLNLIPIGQLDGGHILYAVAGHWHKAISVFFTALLAVMGIASTFGMGGWEGWALWAVLMIIMGLSHPPVIFWEPNLSKSRRVVAWACLVIFVITFIPAPFKL